MGYDGFYRTKVLIAVEVSHQFSPKDGVNIVTGLLTVPAIQQVDVLGAITNFRLFEKPSEEFVYVDLTEKGSAWDYSDKKPEGYVHED